MSRHILLVRHGAVPSEYQDHYIGAMDIPLSAEGQTQAKRLAPLIRAQPIVRCFCSPLQRAEQTARVIVPAGISIHWEEDLKEINFGEWENKTFQEIFTQAPQQVAEWTAWDPAFCFPGGESLADYQTRIKRIAARLAVDPAEKILVITHSGVIRSLICHFLGLGRESFWSFEVKYATLSTIELYEDQGVLIGLNEKWPASS